MCGGHMSVRVPSLSITRGGDQSEEGQEDVPRAGTNRNRLSATNGDFWQACLEEALGRAEALRRERESLREARQAEEAHYRRELAALAQRTEAQARDALQAAQADQADQTATSETLQA
eukprot:1062484-Pyramimonas_sp.AAC.1